jgi:hypothetical protein
MFNPKRGGFVKNSRRAAMLIAAAACTCVFANRSVGADFYYVWPGDSSVTLSWSDPAAWSATLNGAGGAGVPNNGDNAIMQHSTRVSCDVALDIPVTLGSLRLNGTNFAFESVLQDQNTDFRADSELLGGIAGAIGIYTQGAGTNTTASLSVATAPGSLGMYTLRSVLIADSLSVGERGSGLFGISLGTLLTSAMRIGSGTSSVGSFTFDNGVVTCNGDEYIGYTGAGTFAHNGGTHAIGTDSVQHTLVLGQDPSGRGTYLLAGGSAALNVNGGITIGVGGASTFSQSAGVNSTSGVVTVGQGAAARYLFSGGSVSAGELRVGGTIGGTFNQSAGAAAFGTVPAAQGLIVGQGGNGIYLLSGGTSSLSVTGDETVGGTGAGTFSQSNGNHSVSRDLLLGGASGSGTFLLSGGTLSVGATAHLGATSYSGTFIQSGGACTVGTLELGGSIPIGNPAGYYRMDGGTLQAGLIALGPQGTGSFIQNAGQVSAAELRVGGATTVARGFYQLNGGVLSATQLNVGLSNVGTFVHSAGSATVQTLSLGSSGVGAGTYLMSGASASLTVSGVEAVGHNGAGVFTQSNGAHLVQNSLILGWSGQGVYNLSGGTLSVLGYERIAIDRAGTFNQSGGVHNAATISVGTGGAPGAYQLGGGTLTLASELAIEASSTFTWSGGSLSVSSIRIGNAATMIVNKTSSQPLIVSNLDIDRSPGSTALLDLKNNPMIIDYGATQFPPTDELRQQLLSGHVIGGVAPGTRVGYGDNQDPVLRTTSFAGIVFDPDDFTQLLVMPTYAGDANLDGQVDISDLFSLAMHWGDTGAVWTQGDFNYNGVVDARDLGLLAVNWQAGTGAASEASFSGEAAMFGLPAVAVPEPSIPLLIAAAAGATLKRRARGRRS